jgi:TRAP-type C4-dicarboxylate transport system substrate-binding protein
MRFKWLAILLGVGLALGALAPAQAADKFNWSYLSGIPNTHDFNAKFVIPAFDRIRERTGGNLDIRHVFLPETPFKFPDMLTVIRDGQIEMAGWAPSYTSGTYPALAVVGLPFLLPKLGTMQDSIAVAERIYETPELAAAMNQVLEAHDAMVLAHYFSQPMNFWFLKPVDSVAGMKGLKLRVFTPELAELVTGIDATPVNISSPEVYSALQQGVIDGVVTGIGNMRGPKWSEVLQSGFITNVMMFDFIDIVSKSAFDALPAEYQAILVEEMAKADAGLTEYVVASIDEERKALAATGFAFADATPEDYAFLRSLAEERVWPGWKERSGAEAAAVFDKIQEQLGKQ